MSEAGLPSIRDRKMLAFLDLEHFRFRRDPGAIPGEGEVAIEPGWTTQLDAPATPLTDRMQADFRRFCAACLEVGLAEDGEAAGRIVWALQDPIAEPFDRKNPDVEAFTVTVSPGEIRITARHERGLLHGTHHLEWLMADRGGPFLKAGTLERRPAFMPRLSNGVFINGHQLLTNPGTFNDDYLALMSHYGVNGIHVYVDLWAVFRSASVPELNSPDFETQIAALNAFNRRLLAFGIDLYLHINTPPLMEDHPAFLAHPDIKGSLVEIFMEELSGRPWHNLCSGSPLALQAYSEALENLFTAAPELAGMMMIIGGECFYHCFTRPADSDNGDTNCPHCRGKSASREVATLMNLATAAVKKTGAHKTVFCWPYSALIWSSKDPAEIGMLQALNDSVSVLANFDCGDADERAGSGVRFFDYNIKCIGPSETFRRQAETQQSLGRPIFTKIETCTTADAFFLPNLPLYFRWHERFRNMRGMGVAGYVGQWRFFGMNASPPEELLYRLNWEDASCEELLHLRCRRDFHLTDTAAAEVVDGWRKLSEAWDSFPYSAMTSGERAAYMRGPFYLGPAHPLIFDVQDTYDLPPDFRLLRGDLNELSCSDDERAELQRKAKPRYVSDLLITLPFGVERYLELLRECRTKFEAGLSQLRRHLANQNDRARLELNICESLGSHLQSLESTVTFYSVRDYLQNVRCTVEEFHERLACLKEVLNEEIANATRMLPILDEDFRIGYGHCYGPVYDAGMVRAKIAQCRYVRDVELPRFSKVIRFHVWGESP